MRHLSRAFPRSLGVAAALLGLAAASCAELGTFDLGELLGGESALDEGTVARGLVQALEVGTERTTTALSRPGAFADSARLRIGLPEALDPLARTLRTIGLGARVDALEDAMNAAAERAAADAAPVFGSAIRSMSIADAFAILNGPEDAATRYFQERTADSLRARFAPLAGQAMREVGLYAIYESLVARYDAIPLAKPPAIDLEAYVADRTLDGLFAVLAEEEARIRQDPVARSTALLRRVFGSAGGSAGDTAGGSLGR